MGRVARSTKALHSSSEQTHHRVRQLPRPTAIRRAPGSIEPGIGGHAGASPEFDQSALETPHGAPSYRGCVNPSVCRTASSLRQTPSAGQLNGPWQAKPHRGGVKTQTESRATGGRIVEGRGRPMDGHGPVLVIGLRIQVDGLGSGVPGQEGKANHGGVGTRRWTGHLGFGGDASGRLNGVRARIDPCRAHEIRCFAFVSFCFLY